MNDIFLRSWPQYLNTASSSPRKRRRTDVDDLLFAPEDDLSMSSDTMEIDGDDLVADFGLCFERKMMPLRRSSYLPVESVTTLLQPSTSDDAHWIFKKHVLYNDPQDLDFSDKWSFLYQLVLCVTLSMLFWNSELMHLRITLLVKFYLANYTMALRVYTQCFTNLRFRDMMHFIFYSLWRRDRVFFNLVPRCFTYSFLIRTDCWLICAESLIRTPGAMAMDVHRIWWRAHSHRHHLL